MDLSALLKPQALRNTYLTSSSYKTPNFRPTDRPTDFGRKKLPRPSFPMFSFPCTGDNLSDFDITQNESHASPSLHEAIRRKNPQPDFGSRSNVGTAQEVIVEQSFPTGGGVNILGISVLQVSSYRPQADGKSLLCSRGRYSRNKVVPHPSGEPSSARLERRGCPGQPFMRAGHETLTNRSPNWSGLFLMPVRSKYSKV